MPEAVAERKRTNCPACGRKVAVIKDRLNRRYEGDPITWKLSRHSASETGGRLCTHSRVSVDLRSAGI